MEVLKCDEICYFRSTGKFTILDERQIKFYGSNFTRKGTQGLPVEFSLPIGLYYVDGNIQRIKPFVRQLPVLPKIERLKEQGDYEIIFAPNPNKCTINYLLKTITFDPVYKTYPKFVLFFILYHEFGHTIYQTEEKADIAAVWIMLKRGYNKSQIGLAPYLTLSQPLSFSRKINVAKILKNLK